MVRIKVDSPEKVERWLAQPAPAIFQGQDLRWRSAEMVQRPLAGCAFLGCAMAPELADRYRDDVAEDITRAFESARYGGREFDPRTVAELRERWRSLR